MRFAWAVVCVLASVVIVQTDAQRRRVAAQCQVVPSPGRCQQNQRKRFWSYSAKTGGCTQLFGCYGIRDRNVFITKRGCERNCYISGGNRPPTSALECDVNPSPGLCSDNAQRTFWTYSSKTSSCIQVTGCYTLSDRNVFLTRLACRRNCVLNQATTLPAIIPRVPENLPAIFVNNTVTRAPEPLVRYKVNVECRVNPSPGVCSPSERRNLFTYSSKSSTCVKIYGCYSIRDRNVFLTRDGCRKECLIRDDGSTEWTRDAQCYITPSPGRCDINQQRNYWSFSSKTNTCTKLFGCYGIRDRNVFLTSTGCRRHCVGNETAIINPPDMNIKIALECRINPSPGICRDREKRHFYSYSSKTGDCIEIFGCYSVRDRNVFLKRPDCRSNCFLSDGGSTMGSMEAQCYIHPSQGRCRDDERRTFSTYSTKTATCVEIFGCYGIRDRNVFLTREGCNQACSGNGIGPVTLPTIDGITNTGGAPPSGTDYTIAPECQMNPSPDVCPKTREREYFMYSSKSNSCVRIYGCYSIYERNVFLTRDGCRRNCYVYSGVTAAPGTDAQCYLNPSPGRCRDEQKRNYYSYSSKTMSCSRIYGCYSIHDRNVFLTQAICESRCTPNMKPISTPPPIHINKVAPQCRIVPSPNRCAQQDRRTYYSYSTKTHTCTALYGCYSLKDRNVFLTRNGCTQNCLVNHADSGFEQQCFVNPAPGNCPANRRRSYYSYSQKTHTCVQIYGCYSIRDRNVFLTRTGCSRRCGGTSGRPDSQPRDSAIESTTRSQFEISFVDIRNIRNGGITKNLIDVRNDKTGNNANMVDIRGGGNSVDIRNNNNLLDIRRDAGGIVPGSGMVDIRRGPASSGVKMVDVRKQTRPSPGGNLIDIRSGNGAGGRLIDLRNSQTGNNIDIRDLVPGSNMVDVRTGGGGFRGGAVDIRADTSGGSVDIRGGRGGAGFVDIRNGGSGGGSVDIRGGTGSAGFVDIRGNSRGNNVDIRNNNGGSFVDIRPGESMPGSVDIRQGGGNFVDIRNGGNGNTLDIRQPGFGGTNRVDIRNGIGGTNVVDVRGGGQRGSNNFVDIRSGGSNANLVDVRGNPMVDIRGSSTNTLDIRGGNKRVDIRGQVNGKPVDIRGSNSMVDIRGQVNGKNVDIRGNNKNVDIRGQGNSGNMLDIRGGNNRVDIRGGSNANTLDIRGGGNNNRVDIRDGTNRVDIRDGTNRVDIRDGTNRVDIRDGTNRVDIRDGTNGNTLDIRGGGSNFVDIRGGNNGFNTVDIRGGNTGAGTVDIRTGSTNGNNRVDIRGDGSGNLVDVRGGSSGRAELIDIRPGAGNTIDIRGGTTTGAGMVDIRGGSSGVTDIRDGGGNTFVDIRDGNTGLNDIRSDTSGRTNLIDIREGANSGVGLTDIRGGSNSGRVDIRGGSSGVVDIRGGANNNANMVDIRGGNSGTVDIRGGSSNNAGFVDIRGGLTNGAGTVDIRGGSTSSNNMVDIRGGSGNNVDIRGGNANNANMVDIRGGTNNGGSFVDIRGGSSNTVDIRGGSSNTVDIRGGSANTGMVDIRGDGSGNLLDIRGGSNNGANMVDIRGGGNNNLLDIRGGSSNSGNMVDIRGGSGGNNNFVDIRGGSSTSGNLVDIRPGMNGAVDIRGGASGSEGMTDIRGSGTVDIRGGSGSGTVDIRGGSGSGTVDIRGGSGSGTVDIRGGSGSETVDIRGGSGSGTVDIRGGSGSGTVDIRGGSGQSNFVDIRTDNSNPGVVDIRGGSSGGGFVDIRNGGSGGFVDIRNNTSGSGFVDIRNGASGGMVDIRNSSSGGFVDIRNGASGGFVDLRNGSSSGFVDIRNDGSSGFIDIRNNGSSGGFVDIRGGNDGGTVDIRNPSNNGFIDIRNPNNGGNVDIRNPSNNGFIDIRNPNNGGFVDIRNGSSGGNFIDIRNSGGQNMVDIRDPNSPGFIDIRGDGSFVDIRGGNSQGQGGIDNGLITVYDPTKEITSLTDLPIINIEPGIRIARECLINPTPGICLENQRKTFWTFSTKTNSCTRITGCFDIHDRNTWLTLNGCRNNCFKNDSKEEPVGVLPLECQLNPTPGRCLASEERTVWVYNTKLAACMELTGCYDFHDRNVWSSRARCRTKCRLESIIVAPEIPYDVKGITIAQECHINPSPGRCLENDQKTFWTFSSKTSACTRITGCYNIRDRNTWHTRNSCESGCIINETDIITARPLECKLVPSPGRCLDSQKRSVWTYSEKLGICVELTGCYDFHDRNVWRTIRDCNNRCHVNISAIPNLNDYEIALECQLNPSPGRCNERDKRTFYSFSNKAGSCVEIYGCYTINDRNVWYTRGGCRRNCLIPRKGIDTKPPEFVAPGCLRPPMQYHCIPGQRTMWHTYDINTGGCVQRQGCYRMGDRNVFVNKRRCEVNCYGRLPDHAFGGLARECRLNPTPGVCREDERQVYWSYSQKTGTCVRLTGCYTIRDRNVWLSRQMCRNNCIKREYEQRSSVLPNFLADATKKNARPLTRRGRRGRLITRNNNRDPITTENHGTDIVVQDIFTTIDITIPPGAGPVTSMAAVNNPPAPVLREARSPNINVRPTSRVLENLFVG